MRPVESDEEIGQRGEDWVFRMECNRLRREYGVDPDSVMKTGDLVWVSKIQPMANHDIRSIWITPSGERRRLYIEVKASSGRERRFWLSGAEFDLALSQGADYWLCFVGNAGARIPDKPIIYRDLARYITQKQVTLTLRRVTMVLPAATQGYE